MIKPETLWVGIMAIACLCVFVCAVVGLDGPALAIVLLMTLGAVGDAARRAAL